MKNIGFCGGSSVFELGPSADVHLFFECLDVLVARQWPDQDWSLLTDRLYRRYLRQEQLDSASMLMNQAKKFFSTLPSSSVNWEDLPVHAEGTRLNPELGNLADIFSKYFEGFDHCVGSAKAFFNSWGIYQAVRTVISDVPELLHDKERPLDQYDALQGDPFWLS